MDRDFGPNRPIDYDFHKARALALRQREIDRQFERLVAWLRSRFSAAPSASPRLRSGKSAPREAPKLTPCGAPGARC